MSQRKKNILLSIIALGVGFLLYVIFRPNTYIGGIVDNLGCTDTMRQICAVYANDLWKFYMPDFLWAFSLGCCLVAVYNPGTSGLFACSSVSFLCGSAWELLQHLNVASGTADIHDVIMYFLASAICILINLKEIVRK